MLIGLLDSPLTPSLTMKMAGEGVRFLALGRGSVTKAKGSRRSGGDRQRLKNLWAG